MNARLSFDAELESLSASLIRMGALATDAIDKAIEALEANDGALAQSVIAGDRNIDDMERSIEHQCLTLLLRQQPVAGDLRKISTAIKMITDIERIGDAAADIAEITTHIKEHGIPRERGIKTINGIYLPTAKNLLVADFYATIGFEKISGGETGSVFRYTVPAERTPLNTVMETVLL